MLITLAISGCGVTRFGTGYDIEERTVPGSVAGALLGDDEVELPLAIDVTTETTARGTGPARHIYLTSFTLSVTSTSEPSGDTDDLGFIDRIEVFVESTQQGSTLPRMRIASLDPAPDGQRTLSLDGDGVDLLPYVREGSRLMASAVGSSPDDDTSYDGRVELVVVVL